LGQVLPNISLRCGGCGRDLGREYLLSRCPYCGALPLVIYDKPVFRPNPLMPGVWRYVSLLPTFRSRVSRGEGHTPISRVGSVYIKNERFNPTGSYADRASALIASYIAHSGIKRVLIRYEEAFSKSMAYYLSNSDISEVLICIEDPLEISAEDFLHLLRFGKISACSDKLGSDPLGYANPLTIEGLKTIVFELYERRIDLEYAVVPAKSGILALSLAKGLHDLEEAGIDAGYDIVAAIKKGDPIPEMIRNMRRIRLVEVSREEIIESLRELAERGIYTAPLSAVGYHVAKHLDRAVAIITIGYKLAAKRRESELKNAVIRTLERLGKATAYEIWRENQGYSLRGIYKAIRSMAEENIVCEEVVVRGSRKVKKYRLCD
jgi:threonine synthase